MKNPFQGLFTALITPFTPENELDEEGLITLIKRQVNAHVEGIVLLGTTGESPLLTHEEKIRIVKIAKKTLSSFENPPSLIVGGLFFSSKDGIQDCLEMENIGIEGHLILPPPYLRPSQEGILSYFKEIAKNVSKPILIYDNPGRTGVSIHLQTLMTLAHEEKILGVKFCSPHFLEAYELIEETKRQGLSFSVLSGDDAMVCSLIPLGATGLVSVASNLLPEKIHSLVTLLRNKDLLKAKELFDHLYPLLKALFLETNPSPLKKAMELSSLPGGLPRDPFLPCSLNTTETLSLLLNKIGKSHGN